MSAIPHTHTHTFQETNKCENQSQIWQGFGIIGQAFFFKAMINMLRVLMEIQEQMDNVTREVEMPGTIKESAVK